MLMVANRVAADFEGTADFVSRAAIVKVSNFKGGMDFCRLLACCFSHSGATEIACITKNSEKLREIGAQRLALNADYAHLHRVGTKTNSAITTRMNDTGNKFPPMSVITDPAFALAGNTALLTDNFRGCKIC
jgi:hypothetical protein